MELICAAIRDMGKYIYAKFKLMALLALITPGAKYVTQTLLYHNTYNFITNKPPDAASGPPGYR